mmetsp:Transcript_42056/g.89803  ORF Transcript_42056/g.89803 Transcript_42056/m.89803 type:complete len:160 (-) Transcript_42056:30-509(-)
MQSGSVESERAKVRALLAFAQELEEERALPFDPTAAGFLTPDAPMEPTREQRRVSRLSDLHGSFTLRQLGEEKRRRQEEEREAAEAKEQAKRQRLEVVEAAAVAREVQDQEFARCEHGCKCGVVPWPWAKWKRCPQCGPKPRVCVVKACVQARNANRAN